MEILTTQAPWPNARRPQWIITFSWAVVGGQMECVGLEVRSYNDDSREWFDDYELIGDPRPVTTSLLRQIPLATLIDADRAKTVDWYRREFLRTGKLSADGGEALEGLLRHWENAPARKPGRRRERGSEHFADVAAVYARALAEGRPPTQAVSDHFQTSHSTAAKWVARARRDGFLGKTRKGQAGGARPRPTRKGNQ